MICILNLSLDPIVDYSVINVLCDIDKLISEFYF